MQIQSNANKKGSWNNYGSSESHIEVLVDEVNLWSDVLSVVRVLLRLLLQPLQDWLWVELCRALLGAALLILLGSVRWRILANLPAINKPERV